MDSTTGETEGRPWLKEPAAFTKTTFDYIVVGGGTAGLTVASRLAEDSRNTVGVIEAGLHRLDDPIITDPANWVRAPLTNSSGYSWTLTTAPQDHAHGRSIPLVNGKVLGGSSAINLMAYMRANKADYDNWEALGNTGWNWESLLPYFRKIETFVPQKTEIVFPGVDPSQKTNATQSRDTYHGTRGPLNITHNDAYDPLIHPAVKAFNALGIATNYDPNSGNATGIFNIATTVNRGGGGTRSYAANTYLKAVKDQGNISVVTGAQAARIIFSKNSNSDGTGLMATGVEFVSDGTSFTAHASKEVILAAGTYLTPQVGVMYFGGVYPDRLRQLLELSGIGDAKLLSKYNIPCLLNLPQVGENYQEHVGAISTFGLKADLPMQENSSNTLSAISFFPLKKIVPEATLAEMMDELSGLVASTPLQKAQYDIQRKSVGTDIGTAEILLVGPLAQPEKASFWNAFAAIQHPYSRGNIHIQSKDPLCPPNIDGHFLESPFDVTVLRKITQFIRKLATTEPLGSLLSDSVLPQSSTETDEEYDDFVREAVQTVYHPVGTAAMAPREIGGVVDTSLRVYGTRNVRVVDASIIPLHIAAHPQATVYAVAEKAADIIKSGQ